ncbi:PLP-dependent aminotransferase family protein [Bacillus sp. AGMB 02131]|uniref:PLP-dependent aminotransferase family protein n=1 Tax=Peribacillus faecalis TaxID=2772559 RepID=A0A927HB91_9BACI|nr:PLP-dependent aminotransferase family protein [Peribacillus faecalis]MBD3108744.1 PLP-dependent aminotransferase family protein [Peribacillus faecalis]
MDMLSCHLNRLDRVPLYEQLYEYIKKEILEGRLSFQDKLPSKRKLADFLKISHNTIDTAYNQLVAEGYVEVVPRKGYFVMAYEDLAYIPKQERPKRLEKEHCEVRYHFHPSQIDTGSFPFHTWRKLLKQYVAEENQQLLLLGNHKGEYALQKEIANYLYHARGLICSPEQIIIGAGIEILLQQLLVLLNEKTVYGVEDPGYHLIHRILSTYPKRVHPLEVDEEGLIVERLDELAIDVAYVTPSHHFPYGNVLPVNRRMQLLNWASANEERYIIEDDYDSEFRYSGKMIPSLQSMDQGGKVIYLGSFSKSLMPSIRISYMVLPETLLKKYEKKLSFYHCTVSRIDQHILAEFIQKGLFEKHLNRMRKVYRQKLELVLCQLKSYSQQISIIGGHSGLHVVLQIQNGMTEEELVERAAKEQMKVYPLSDYMLVKKQNLTPTIVLGFAGIPIEQLEEALTVLLKSWRII